MENKTKIKTKKRDNSHSLQSFLFISKPGESVGEMCMSSSEIKTVELVLCSFHCSGKKEKKKRYSGTSYKKSLYDFGDST